MGFKTEVCTCPQFPGEAMQWIKELELDDSVDELRSSSSTRSISMPNFEVLDARIASALNKIFHNSKFKRRISLEEQKTQKQDSFFRGRQIAYLIYDHFRVTGSHDLSRTTPTYPLLFFQMTIFRNSILSGTEWCYCTMRHAQIQHAQQSVLCLVVVGSELCTHRCLAQVYLNVSVVGSSTPAPCAKLTLRVCAQSLKMCCYFSV